MEHIDQSVGWKIRKAARYVGLYGFRRTWVKVKAQYHMRRKYDRLPERMDPARGGHVGIIGCGQFAYSTITYFLRRNFGPVVRACMDVDVERAASMREDHRLRYYTDDAAELFADPAIDLIFIASNHASHAEYAIEALRAGKAVHIEKPHCVNEEQLRRLCDAVREVDGKVALGFNRPSSPFGRLIREHLAAQPGTAMFNWFIAGHGIDPEHWYFHEDEGGRILGNFCHWSDFVYQIVAPEHRFPIVVSPTRDDQPDGNVAVTYRFGDGSIAAFTFSAKGHTFEGVRERFAAHKGDLLVSMDDFKTLTLEVAERKRTYRSRHRDHGHEETIRRSYDLAGSAASGADVSYLWETGLLFLKTREALESRQSVVVEPFHVSFQRSHVDV